MNENQKFFSKIGINYLTLAILTIAFQIIIINIISLHDINMIQNINVQTIINSISNYVLTLPIIIYLMNKIESEKIEKKNIKITKFLQYICITITLMWIGNYLGLIITTIIGNSMTNEIINPVEVLIQNSSIYLNLLIISIMAPIFEEIFFRKLLIDRTIKYGANISILLSAGIFGLFHANLSQFFYAFLIGGFFAYIYINTGKITYTILLHMIINLFGSVISPIFVQSFDNINAFNPIDISIVICYTGVILLSLLVGVLIILFNYKKIYSNDNTPEIVLDSPIRNVLLNFGMITFIIYHIILILISLNII